MRNIKKFTAIIISVLMLISVVPVTSYAAVYSGTCGSKLTWTLDENGTLTISGTGAMYDYIYDNYPWISSRVKNVIIEDGVTSIGSYAFYCCSSLTSAMIPDSVTEIKSAAFDVCSALTEIKIPNSVTSIEDYTFWGCTSLTSITIPDGVTSIGDYAFYGCESLFSITIPCSVKSIKRYAFEKCKSLSDVYFTGTIEQWESISVGDYNSEFRRAKKHIDDITFIDFGTCGENLTWMLDENGTLTISGTGAMSNYSYYSSSPWISSLVKNVIVEKGVTSIGDYAFFDCLSLTEITIPDGVTSIGESAFTGCSSLTEITIPGSMKSIYGDAFTGCSSLTDVYYTGTIEQWGQISIYTKYSNSDCREFWSAKKHIDDITVIDLGTCGVNLIYTLDENGTLTISGTGEMTSSPKQAKKYAKSVIIESGVTSIASNAFSGCSLLTEITIPDGVTSIGESAFSGCSSLTKITIPDGVTSIGDYTFYRCSSLTKITIPDSVTSIGKEAFYECNSLADVYYTGTIEQWFKIDIGYYNDSLKNVKMHIVGITVIGLGMCGGNLTWTLDENGTLTISGTGTMYGYGLRKSSIPWYNYRGNVKTVIIENGATSIGDSAFLNCSSLTSVMIPDSVTSIEDEAFSSCSSLTSVTIPDSVTSIGDYAFSYCNSLTSVTIPDSVTSIGDCAFYDCNSLTSVTIPDSVTSIGVYAFSGCSSLTDVYYAGTQKQWSSVNIGSDNSGLEDATIHLNTIIVPQYTSGDSDGNGVINAKDLNMLEQIILGRISASDKAFEAADINSDGVIGTKDAFLLKKMMVNN